MKIFYQISTWILIWIISSTIFALYQSKNTQDIVISSLDKKLSIIIDREWYWYSVKYGNDDSWYGEIWLPLVWRTFDIN